MLNYIKRNKGKEIMQKRNGRVLALLLCAALCMESMSFTTLAKEAEPESTEKVGHTAPEADEGDVKEEAQNPEEAGASAKEEAQNPEEPGTSVEEEAQNPEEPGMGVKEETQNPEEPGTGVEEETQNPEESGTGVEEETQNPEGTGIGAEDKEAPQEPEQISGNDIVTGSVSENELPSVSDNHLQSVSENSLDGEWKEAKEAFDALLAKKTLMALLYRTDSYAVRSEADEDSRSVATLEIGQTLYLQGVDITEEDVWYQVQYWLDGAAGTGYVQGYYLAYSDEDWIAWEEEYLQAYSLMPYGLNDSEIEAFPASYQSALRSLKNAHPNWTFVPSNTGLDFNTAVSNEMGDKSLIQKTTGNSEKGWVGEACPSESGWYYATKPAVSYHMDPRNFLTETYIFQFEQLTFNKSYHTESAVQTFLNGTFMKGTLPDDSKGRTYAQAFYEIGSNRKLSPIHLSSRVYQEQGKGTSGLISGNYPGYEGYYNFFNVGVNGASTTEKIVKGLTYAKEKGWNSRYKSLEGGAATIGNNYILKGQDTIYLEKFNVSKDSQHAVYTHQYMQNIQAPASEASSTKKMYSSAGSLNSAFVFKIPVYSNMPKEESDNPEILLQSISLDKELVVLRRPDTVVTDTTGLSAQEKAQNTATAALQVIFVPADTTSDKSIVWSSSNQKIVKVEADPTDSSKAVVTAVGTGEADITAKASMAGNLTAVCSVKVTAPIYRLEVSDASAGEGAGKSALYVGQSVSLSAEYWPKDTTSDHTISWASSNENVAAVQNGKVTAQGEGTAKITASAAGYTASWNVEVRACSVTFHQADGTALERVVLGYGDCIADTDMGELPQAQKLTGSIFRGWYTKAHGQGSVFTENTAVYAEEIHIYPHYQKIGEGFYVIPVGDQIYTGSAIKPKVRVFDGTAAPDGSLIEKDNEEVLELVEGRDYTLSYKNNRNVNMEGAVRPTIVVKGKGNYAGSQEIYFDILPKALSSRDITVQNITAAYSGRVIKGAPVLYRGGQKLALNRDYTVSYPQTGDGAYREKGVYPVVITGKGGYTGKVTVYETITTDILLGQVTVAKIPNQSYSSEQLAKEGGIHPKALKVTYKNQPLTEGVDYTVSYSADQSIGKATATLTAVKGSGYAGSRSVTYQIVGSSLSGAKVEGIVNKTYTGTESDVWQSGYTLTLKDETLVESKDGGRTGDYTVSYLKTDKAGTATIMFKGVNAYSGQLKKTYRILPYEFQMDGIGSGKDMTAAYYTQDEPDRKIELSNLNGMTTPYMKGGSKPVILLRFRGRELTPGKDYSISYKNNKILTTADMEESKRPAFTITGKGNFAGKLAGYFSITDGQFDKRLGDKQKITVVLKDVVYREKKGAWKTKASLKDVDGAVLTAGRDYDKNLQYTYETETEVMTLEEGELIRTKRGAGEAVREEDIPQAGTCIRVTARGIDAYAGEEKVPPETYGVYRIVSADLAKAKVKTATKSYQDGRPVTLTAEELAVTMSGMERPLQYGLDYVIEEESYVNNMQKGKAKVTLRGIGNYGGVKTITYTIGTKMLWWQ